MKPTLLVLAAGMGSRYGSLKQMDGVGPCGEAIIDYSIYDAIRAGFGKVVFVIRHSFADAFKQMYNEAKFGGKIKVEYVFQELDCLPEGYSVPEGREKPWGTNHAVMMASPVIDGPFAVINGDDYYGPEAFKTIAGFLSSVEGCENRYCMVAYRVENTLSEFGGVSRGVCDRSADGMLCTVTERFKIERKNGKIIHVADDREYGLEEGTLVSMNFWGFTPDYFKHSDRIFRSFLDKPETKANPKAEYFIPYAVDELIKSGTSTFKVLDCDAKWFGVTYKEDRPAVVARFEQLTKDGIYPRNIWSK